MGDKRSKQRISSKIDELPEDLRRKVDVMLADTSNTYEYISQFLKGEGYDISKSSVGRYATRTNNAMQRLLEAQAQTDRLIQVVKENPEADYTEAAILLTMNGLLNKVATAEEEFNEMPLDKAGRLIASLSRTKVYKDRVKQDMRKKADTAFRELESEMLKVIKQDDVDIMLDEDGQPVSDGNGDAALVSDEDCWLQDIKNEALTEEGELFYEDEEGDESYGWSLLDFMQGEYDDFMQMEIQQRIRSKLSKREYIDAGSIQTVVKFDGHVYRIRVSFRRNDSNRSYNIDIESDGVEVIVE